MRLRLCASERKLAQMAAVREEQRRRRAEQLKLEAIRRYLLADKSNKETDIDILGISLSTPDASAELLASAHLRLITGRRYGLIGKNGVGTSTMLASLCTFLLKIGWPDVMWRFLTFAALLSLV